MKKILTFLTLLIFVTASLVVAFAQPRQRRRNTNINRGATRTGNRQRNIIAGGAGVGAVRNQPKSAIGAGGAGTYVRNGQRGRYVTRNGKRIWVPQGSPLRVYEREEEAELKKRSTNTNRP